MERTPQEITTLVGREVYSNNGVYVGEVEDIRLDVDGRQVTGLALTETNDELFEELTAGARGILLPYRWVRAVGDVVLVNELVEQIGASEETAEEGPVAVA